MGESFWPDALKSLHSVNIRHDVERTTLAYDICAGLRTPLQAFECDLDAFHHRISIAKELLDPWGARIARKVRSLNLTLQV